MNYNRMENTAMSLFIVVVIWLMAMFTMVITISANKDMVNMNKVTDFTVNGNQLVLYTEDGSSYYWER